MRVVPRARRQPDDAALIKAGRPRVRILISDEIPAGLRHGRRAHRQPNRGDRQSASQCACAQGRGKRARGSGSGTCSCGDCACCGRTGFQRRPPRRQHPPGPNGGNGCSASTSRVDTTQSCRQNQRRAAAPQPLRRRRPCPRCHHRRLRRQRAGDRHGSRCACIANTGKPRRRAARAHRAISRSDLLSRGVRTPALTAPAPRTPYRGATSCCGCRKKSSRFALEALKGAAPPPNDRAAAEVTECRGCRASSPYCTAAQR